MTAGAAKTRYHIVLKKCTEGEMPVITACDIGKDKYDIIQGLIRDRYGIKLNENGERVMRKGGGKRK